MNMYNLIALLVAVIVASAYFDLAPPIHQMFERMADIPEFTSKGNKPHLFDLAVRLAYLIALVGIIKLVLRRRRDDE